MNLAAQDVAPANMFQKQKSGGKKIPAPTSGPPCRWYYYVGVQWCEWGMEWGTGWRDGACVGGRGREGGWGSIINTVEYYSAVFS